MARIRKNPADKWVARAAVATDDYRDGVRNPRTSWKAATKAAAANHSAGVTRAVQEKRFEKAIDATPEETWANKAAGKGADRFASGVQDARSSYEAGFAPFAQVIDSVQLTPRKEKGHPDNYKRVMEMGEALRKRKTGR